MQSLRRRNQVKYFLSDQNVEPWDFPCGREFDPTKYRELTLGKIQKWIVGSRNGTERALRVMSPREAMNVTKGKDLIIVASGSDDLRFRIFKYDGEREDVVAPVKGMLQSRCFDPSGKPNAKKRLGRERDAGESPANRWSQEETGDARGIGASP